MAQVQMLAQVQITTGGKEYVQTATKVLSDAFSKDPTINYILSSMTQEKRDAFRPKFFSAILTASALNRATFDGADEWKSCGVMMPPGARIDGPGTILQAGILPMLWSMGVGGYRSLSDFDAGTNAAKAKHLKKGEKYYYIFMLGTQEDGRGKGLCSAILKHYLQIARKENTMVYLEAVTEYCRGLYEKHGFVTVEEILLGRGRAGPDGLLCPGGPGFKIWAMVWRPEQTNSAVGPDQQLA